MDQRPYRTELECGCVTEEFPLYILHTRKRVLAKCKERYAKEPCPKCGHPSGLDWQANGVCEDCNMAWRLAFVRKLTCAECVMKVKGPSPEVISASVDLTESDSKSS